MTLQRPGGKLGSRERALVILLVIVAVLAGVFVLLVNGGGDDELADTPTPTGVPTATATATPTEPAPTAPPITDDLFDGRDPFQPLVVAGDDGGPPTPGDGGPTPAPTSTARPSDGGETRRVTLLDIFTAGGERRATVQVDGEEFTVAEGETFADNFRLLDLTQDCGTFVFGDERFTLCVGQEVQK